MSERRLDIQGLRGLAVLLVVLFHWGSERVLQRFDVTVFAGGYVGVDVFFVISGFLITGLLQKEFRARTTISLSGFYARRVWRLMPSAALVSITTLLMVVLSMPSLDWVDSARALAATALFGANVFFAGEATDYLAGGFAESPFLHFWSLSVEEQFYLLWPAALLVAFRRASEKRLVTLVLASSFALSVGSIWLSSPWTYFGLHTRAWELGLGALLALSPEIGASWSRTAAFSVRGLGLAAIVGAAALFDRETSFPGVAAALPTAGAAMVLAAGRGTRTGFGFGLRSRPLVWLGDVSYGWYLWHWPFLILCGPVLGIHGTASVGLRSVAVGAALLAAAASHLLFEKRLLTSARSLAARYGAVLAVSLVALSLTVASAVWLAGRNGGGRDARDPQGARYDRVRGVDRCDKNFAATEPDPCFFGMKDGARTVALVGDSHANHLVPAVEEAARSLGWRLMVMTKSVCPLPVIERWLPNYRRPYTECSAWREGVFQRLRDENVDLVISARFSSYADLLVTDGHRAPAEAAPELWERGVKELQTRLPPGSAVAFIKDVPWPGTDVPSCVAREGEGCSLESVGRGDEVLWDAERRGASEFAAAFLVDLTPSICPEYPCPLVAPDGIIKYRDNNHLTASFARTLSPRFKALLEQAAARERRLPR